MRSKRIASFLLLYVLIFIFLSSCHGMIRAFKPHSGVVILYSAKPDTISIKKIAVIPFRTGSLNPVENGVVICHLTGQSFKSGKIEPDSGKNVTSLFHQKLILNKSIELISEDTVNTVYESTDKNIVAQYDFSFGKIIGGTVGADAVLMGVVVRYEEREGTKWAVNRPASAAFTAVLLDVKSGEILWKMRFDKTQQALSENVLDVKNFIRGGGGWQEVTHLLLMGIEDALKDLEK